MRIAVCDDDNIWLETASALISQCRDKLPEECEIHTFAGAGSLLQEVEEKGGIFQIAFIAVVFSHGDGIELARQINGLMPECQIVFVAKELKYAMDVYAAEHIYFVTKEEFGARIEVIMQKAMRGKLLRSRKIVLHMPYRKYKVIAEEELFYFERDLRMTKVHTKNGTLQTRESLESLQERLGRERYIRCHNSFLIFFLAIEEIENHTIKMKNGSSLPVSRKYINEVK